MLLHVGWASVSCMVPIGHVITCGRGQCMWAGPVYVGGASVSCMMSIGHVITCGWG